MMGRGDTDSVGLWKRFNRDTDTASRDTSAFDPVVKA